LNRSALGYHPPVPVRPIGMQYSVIIGHYSLSVNRSALGYAEVTTDALYTPHACLFFAFLW